MSELGGQLARLGRHSAIYGLGGLVSRMLAVLLLPLYTRYLTPADYGQIETLVALTAVLVIVLRAGISSAFFRFYFDSPEPGRRRTVLRTSFWFTMTTSTLGPRARRRARGADLRAALRHRQRRRLVRASGVALWAQMNYEQLTSLFRVEERSTAFVVASLANMLITIGATVWLVVVAEQGPLGVIVGNFTGTLVVYLVLLGYRREQLGLEFDRPLLRAMNRFGLPLVPTALFLWATNFSDRFFLVKLADAAEVGLYSVGVRIASAIVLLLTAFRLAWPAFAYSIERRRRGEAHVRVRAHVPAVARRRGSRSRSRCSRRGSSTCSRRRSSTAPPRVVGPLSLRRGRVRRLHRDRDRERARAADAVQLGRDRDRRRRQRRR